MSASWILLPISWASLALALIGGLLSALYYLPDAYPTLKALGIEMRQLHAVHVTFAIAWIFLAALAVVYRYLDTHPLRTQVGLWITAGLGIILCFGFKRFSGREYLEYLPIFSLLIGLGWLPFLSTMLRRARRSFWQEPVYVFMWTTAAVLFLITLIEAHLWLIPWLHLDPVSDIRLQWKSLGPLVGSFKLLVYGTGIYVSERLSGNVSYARSRLAFSLFGIGLLNTFTNYVHHTYHLPQDSIAKWIAFVVSMLEIIILARVMFEITQSLKIRRRMSDAFFTTKLFLASSKYWTAINLVLAIAISFPPLNSLIHGTHVVAAHAMGATIGIDTWILFAASAWALEDSGIRASLSRNAAFILVVALNGALAGMFASLLASGTATGVLRYLGEAPPPWVGYCYLGLALSGGIFASLVLYLLGNWAFAWSRARALQPIDLF